MLEGTRVRFPVWPLQFPVTFCAADLPFVQGETLIGGSRIWVECLESEGPVKEEGVERNWPVVSVVAL